MPGAKSTPTTRLNFSARNRQQRPDAAAEVGGRLRPDVGHGGDLFEQGVAARAEVGIDELVLVAIRDVAPGSGLVRHALA